MESQSDEFTAYLHRPTGRVTLISEEALHAAEHGLVGDDAGVVDEELADARAIAAGGDDYLPLPGRFDIDEYRMMERFALAIEEPSVQTQVLVALNGKGAFRRFKDAVRQLRLAEAWYAWRDRGYEEVARAWAEANGVVFEPPADVQPH
jgi:hypothetical protein